MINASKIIFFHRLSLAKSGALFFFFLSDLLGGKTATLSTNYCEQIKVLHHIFSTSQIAGKKNIGDIILIFS